MLVVVVLYLRSVQLPGHFHLSNHHIYSLWEEMTFMRDGLHLTGKGAAVLGCEFVRVVDEGTGTINYVNYMRRGN